jgi:protein O-GlcNAc transferase
MPVGACERSQAGLSLPVVAEASQDILARARALRGAGKHLEALQAYDAVLQLGRPAAEVLYETGCVLAAVGETAQAVSMLERAVAARRDFGDAHNELARACYALGEVDRAMRHLALAERHGNRLEALLNQATLAPQAPASSHRRVLALRRALAVRLASEDAAGSGAAAAPGARSPTIERAVADRHRRDDTGRLRVAYLSPHFHQANYMKPVWGLVNHHDRERFRIHLLHDGDGKKELTGYEAHRDDHLEHVHELDNTALRARIAALGIDILVDLAAYGSPARLGLFIQAPAPVTVGWFNSFATSGLPGLHWIVGDDEVIRRREQFFYSERVARLPLSYLTFDCTQPAPPVVEPPCSGRDYLTFGSLVSQYKITPQVLDTSSGILHRAPRANLLLANRELASRHNRAWLAERFAARGVDPERLLLFGPAEHEDFLRYYDRIDVALDAFPYNGGTTTMEALWQGVPVLTCAGDRWASRTSRTLLRRADLGSWVARSPRAMVRAAVRLAHDPRTPEALATLRRGMRQRLAASSACDTQALAHAMERFYVSAASVVRDRRW